MLKKWTALFTAMMLLLSAAGAMAQGIVFTPTTTTEEAAPAKEGSLWQLFVPEEEEEAADEETVPEEETEVPVGGSSSLWGLFGGEDTQPEPEEETTLPAGGSSALWSLFGTDDGSSAQPVPAANEEATFYGMEMKNVTIGKLTVPVPASWEMEDESKEGRSVYDFEDENGNFISLSTEFVTPGVTSQFTYDIFSKNPDYINLSLHTNAAGLDYVFLEDDEATVYQLSFADDDGNIYLVMTNHNDMMQEYRQYAADHAVIAD